MRLRNLIRVPLLTNINLKWMKTQHAQTKSNSRYLRTFCFIQLNINFGYLSVNNSINVVITAFPRFKQMEHFNKLFSRSWRVLLSS